MSQQDKPLAWIGSSKKDLMALPLEVRKFFGHALDFAQRGSKHDAAKVLKGFWRRGCAGHYSRTAQGGRSACQGAVT